MTGPGGDEVARVSVRVAPNTDDFKRDLERQLREIRDAEIQIPVKLDIDKADLERQLQDLRNEDIRIPVNFDVENVGDDVKRATRGLKADPVEVPIELTEADLEAQIQDIQVKLHELDQQEVSPEASLEATDLREELRRLKAELAALSAETYDIKVDEDGITEVRASVLNLRALLESLDRTPIQVEFDARDEEIRRDIVEVESVLARLDGQVVTPEVQVEIDRALIRLTNLRRELDEMGRRRATAIIDLDVNTAGAQAEIAAFVERQRLRHSIGLDLEVDRQTLGGLAALIGKSLNAIIPDVGRVTGVFSELTSGANEFVSGLRTGLGPLQGSLGAIASIALQIGGALLYASAIGTALAFAGAAVTAAWGAVATTIAVLPGTLGLIAAAGGAVALGLDGIKKAASTIAPEFDKLKASVATTFEQRMTPAFKQLATIFPLLQDNINGVARAISFAAINMTVFLTSAQGVGLLEGVFDKTADAIMRMQPGLRDITEAFLTVANQAAVFDLMIGVLNRFGAEFKRSVTDLITDGTLTAAFEGLRGTLEALAVGFVQLVDNGFRVFAQAAPGVNNFLNQLTAFFERFDWGRLGAAVGGVFDGLARGLQNVPQGVIDNITRGFEGFAQAVNSQGFQAGLQAAIDLIGRFVAALPAMVDAVSRAAVAFSGFVDVIMAGVSLAGPAFDLMLGIIQGRGDLIGKALLDMGKAGSEAAPLMAQGMAKIAEAAREGGPRIVAGVQAGIAPVGPAVAAAITTAMHPAVPAVQAELAKLGPAATVSLRNADLAIEQGVKNWEATAQAGAAAVPPVVGQELGQVPPAANAALAPLQQLEALKGMRDQFTLAAADSMHAMSVGVQSGMAEVQMAFKTGMDTASSGISGSFTLMESGFTIGMQGLAQQVTLGMTAVQTSFTTGFGTIATGIGTSIAPIRANIAIAMAGLTQEVSNGMITVTLAFQQGFTGIAAGIGTSIAPIRANIAIAMAGLTQEVTNGMIMVTLAFQTGFTTIATGIGTAIAPIRANVAIAMAGLAQEVTNGMIQVTLAFQIGFANVAVGIGGAIAPIRANVAIAMVGLGQEVTNGFVGIQAAFTAGFAAAAASVTTGMAGASAAMSSGFASMAGVASAGMSQVTAAIQAGMAIAVAAVVNAGAQIGAAAQTSMAAFGAAIATGTAQATAAVAAGTSQMNVQFIALGQQIVTTAAQSMAAFGNSVRTGMTQAVAAVAAGVAGMVSALRAGQGQFFSVGVQMMAGLRAGILSQAGSIAAAAASVVSGAIAAARAAGQVRSPSRVFMEIGSFLGEGLAIGMEKSVPRIDRAADAMADAAVGSADRIGSAFASSALSGNLSANVAHSLSDLSGSSNQAMLGQQRVANGELTQSTALLAAIVAELRAMRAAGARGGGSLVGATAGSRQRSELGAF